MPKTEQRLKSPDRAKLNAFIEVCHDAMDEAEKDGAGECEALFVADDVLELAEMLEWIAEFLNKRTEYHKDRAATQKTERTFLEEALRRKGVDIEALKKRARNLAADEAVDTSDEEPVRPRATMPGGGE